MLEFTNFLWLLISIPVGIIYNKITNHESRISAVETRQDVKIEKLNELSKCISKLDEKLDSHSIKMAKFETKLDEHLKRY